MSAHALHWFEIPALQLERAFQFYHTVLNARVRMGTFGGQPLALFDVPFADGSAIGGSIVQRDGVTRTLETQSIEGHRAEHVGHRHQPRHRQGIRGGVQPPVPTHHRVHDLQHRSADFPELVSAPGWLSALTCAAALLAGCSTTMPGEAQRDPSVSADAAVPALLNPGGYPTAPRTQLGAAGERGVRPFGLDGVLLQLRFGAFERGTRGQEVRLGAAHLGEQLILVQLRQHAFCLLFGCALGLRSKHLCIIFERKALYALCDSIGWIHGEIHSRLEVQKFVISELVFVKMLTMLLQHIFVVQIAFYGIVS